MACRTRACAGMRSILLRKLCTSTTISGFRSTRMFKHRYTKLALIGLVTVTLAGCATHDRRHNNTMVGAGLGAAAGAVVSQGNPWYTLGGAARSEEHTSELQSR